MKENISGNPIDDWLLCIVIASVVQWSALCLAHWRSWLNFCGKHNIFNFKRNAIMSIAPSYITTDNSKKQISVGSGESCELTPRRPGFKSGWCHRLWDSFFYFMRIIKSSITIVLTKYGALISSESNTLNNTGSVPRKNVVSGTTVDIHQRKHRGLHCCFLLVIMKKNIRGNTVVLKKRHKG